MANVRLGIIGLGNMGSSHIRDHVPYVNRLELTAVCDVLPERLAKYPDVAHFTSASQLIASGTVDAILIATPHYDHTTIGIEALQAGLHVLVEKPISVHKADCERLIAAHTGRQVFAAMFNQRTDPRYRAIRQLIQSGELGELRRIQWTVTDWFRSAAYYASSEWRATWRGEGGGILLNQCPHNLDLYQWLFGVPTKVHAFMEFGRFHDIEVEDNVTAYLEHENGAKGVIIATTGEAPGTNRLEIVGDRGRVVFEDGRIEFRRTLESVQEFCDTTPNSFPTMPTWKCEIPPAQGGGGQHLEVLRNFVDAILDGAPLIAPAAEGIRSVSLANAMILSGWTGETISLPLDGARYEEALRARIAESTRVKEVRAAEVANLAGTY